MNWNSNQYLLFDNERTQPAIDLANRITLHSPKNIIDIGCGPGNSTEILKEHFPNAHILGVDSSSNMIEKACSQYPDIAFSICDIPAEINRLSKPYDVVFSNACLQWIPNHRKLLPTLFSLLSPDGMLAVQIPKNGSSPLYLAMDEVVSETSWGFDKLDIAYNGSLSEEEYFNILSSLTTHFTIWETTYYHRMASYDALVEWIKGTKLRPYLSILDETKQQELQSEILKRIKDCYSIQTNGEIIYKFQRLFFIACNN